LHNIHHKTTCNKPKIRKCNSRKQNNKLFLKRKSKYLSLEEGEFVRPERDCERPPNKVREEIA
jgi:hypothetical protein